MDLISIMLFCEDIKGLTAFYRDVVGLTPATEQPFPEHKFFQFVSNNGFLLNLHSGTKPNGGRQKLQLHCADIEPLLLRLKAAKHRFRKPVPDFDGAIVFDFRDPEGNRIQVYSRDADTQ